MKYLGRLPEPDRAKKNIDTFLSEHPDLQAELDRHIEPVSALFSYSQFLANYCTIHPDSLFKAIGSLHAPVQTAALSVELREALGSCSSVSEGMKTVRLFRKDKQIGITLRDILHLAELPEIMLEMSDLADVILSESLGFVISFLEQRYGSPVENFVSVMALGKLGAQELNYSSDVDIVFVYRREGETSGVSSIPGITMNRVSAMEYYVKLAEEFSRFISANTEDGFAYRVDLRLRPEGQRGSLALSLKGYEDYYEAWGQLWEKAALLRTRCVAGDEGLGRDFISALTPFIYRKYLDLDTIDEIKRMKSQVEQLKKGTFSRDIKRGFGGIREIEFFIQIFQLMYGGKEPILRERSTIKALHRLVQKGLIGYEDLRQLSENYVFLRTLEHRIQQMNDIQTHTLPSGDNDLGILGRKMGFEGARDFLDELDRRRRAVRSIYDSLFADRGSVPSEGEGGIMSRIFWDAETPIKKSLEEELARRGVRDVEKAISYLMQIRSNIYSFQTIRGRKLLEDVIPRFVESALGEDHADAALLQLVGFSRLLAASESYLDLIVQQPAIIGTYTFVFSHSDYLSKILVSNPEYMESLAEVIHERKSLNWSKKELLLLIERKGESAGIRIFRRLEEIRLGILFLNRKTDVASLAKGISTVAEAVLSSLTDRHCPALTIAGFGKLGGREIIFGSDLDVVFFTLGDPDQGNIKAAENLIKTLMSYTKDGIGYKVDTRLRPDGSKGPLVTSIEGMANYYLKNAQTWELQALLKARPVCGDRKTIRYFGEMRKEVLMKRSGEISLKEIRQMRERIRKELSKDAASVGVYDIKLGSGGLEELEFAVQYLQLKNCNQHPSLLVQGTLDGIRRLKELGIITPQDASALWKTYTFYRTIEAVLRLRNETLLKEGSDTLLSASRLLGLSEGVLIERIGDKRTWISSFISRAGE